MDEAIIKRYRILLRAGFEYAGEIESPSVSVDAINVGVPMCGNPEDYMRLYINIKNDTIDLMKYLCLCEPTTNVAVEILCKLVKGKPIKEIRNLTAASISSMAESDGKELLDKSKKLIELMNKGLDEYQDEAARS